ncbi:hypothetical protein TBK1r_17620 [Stieleria magnilauensis]|uniref:Uncharacterized protein n=1 Tax=Stieleria magnilauensis TaxID=2527963 RepID=A0ABX5XLG8_9BACT|nr:hypothetical protein TBK1r_17620 [Planctomycetes bacterium TBK1r]
MPIVSIVTHSVTYIVTHSVTYIVTHSVTYFRPHVSSKNPWPMISPA